MTGKQAKVVKAAYNAMVQRGLRSVCRERLDWEAFDQMREQQDAYIAARYRPYPRYDEQMAALGEKA